MIITCYIRERARGKKYIIIHSTRLYRRAHTHTHTHTHTQWASSYTYNNVHVIILLAVLCVRTHAR